MLLAIHILMAPVVTQLRSADPTQARPIKIGAAVLSPEGAQLQSFDGFIKPQGWRVPDAAGVAAEDANRGISLVTAMAVISDWRGLRLSGLVLYGAKHTGEQYRVCREICGMRGVRRHRQRKTPIFDLATEAKQVLGEAALVPLASATERICGERIAGLAGLLALNGHPEILKIRETSK